MFRSAIRSADNFALICFVCLFVGTKLGHSTLIAKFFGKKICQMTLFKIILNKITHGRRS